MATSHFETLAKPPRARLSTTAKRLLFRWHQQLAIIGGIALLMWGVSGLLHPLMTIFGPQQAVFMPPMQPIDLQGSRPIGATLAEAGIERAEAIRLVPGHHGPLWQVTQAQDRERRYFEPDTGAELPRHDREQALWLARHWLAKPDTPVKDIVWVTEFSSAYPAVNRLLPVWRVTFDTEDALTAWIYTETGSLASVSNDWKMGVQRWFQWVHTWSFLPRDAEWVRVLLITALVGTLFLMAATGVGLLFSIRRKLRAPGSRGWHRVAAYALALPVLALSGSGIFHLIQNGWDEPARVLRLSPPISVATTDFGLHEQWLAITDGISVAGVSLVEAADGTMLTRLALMPPRDGSPATPSAIRNARFDGIQPTGPALYLDNRTGMPWAQGDRELALQLGERFTGAPRSALQSATLVTRFGAGYDFRNKRLPVWRLDYGAPIHASIFVDTATGVLADKAPHSGRTEQWSFSVLHKWDFLRMFGREAQTIIVSVVVASIIILMGVIGLQMEWKRRSRAGGRRTDRAAAGRQPAA